MEYTKIFFKFYIVEHMNWPEIYSKVDKQCRSKYLAFTVELVLTELSLSVWGIEKL